MKKSLVFSGLLCVSGVLWAAKDASSSLEHLLNTMETFEAAFTQVTKEEGGNILQSAKGTVALKRPGKFRWVTESPEKQILVADGKNLWIYDPELEQASVQSLKETIYQSPAILISAAHVNLANDFQVTTEKDPHRQLWYVLTPKKNENGAYSVVKLYFEGNALTVLKIKNNLGQWNTLRFTKIKTNLPLRSQLFIFQPPKNVDVIDNTNEGLYSHAQ